MSITQLSPVEQSGHDALLSALGDVALLTPTATGLSKSILDATISVRALLQAKGLHDFVAQLQGQDSKRQLPTTLLSETRIVSTKTSLYRPHTKQGDPRIWITGLGQFASPGDILVLFANGDGIGVVNITQTDVQKVLKAGAGPLVDEILRLSQIANAVSIELLSKLREIASTPVRAICGGDTAVGRTLETLLGIEQNSRKTPDYKGIELKSFRGARGIIGGGGTRAGLFAQVANWEKSKLKSSAAILREFGYSRPGGLKLYCTLSTNARNPQGLGLLLDLDEKCLIETSLKSGLEQFLWWDLPDLHRDLLTKHRETFWIRAHREVVEGSEYFRYESVRHTKNPSVAQFDEFLASGVITVDHLIKEEGGRTREKGPLFKIPKKYIPMLFPNPNDYSLLN